MGCGHNYADVFIDGVSDDIADRFMKLCHRKDVAPATMFETMVRSFDRGSQTYSTDMRFDFGKYAGMNVEDVIRSDTQYVRWLVNNSSWFKLDSHSERLLRMQEAV